MLFRVRKEIQWAGIVYQPGEFVEIPEGNPRIRAMVEQSRHIEYANTDKPSEPQGIPVSVIRE